MTKLWSHKEGSGDPLLILHGLFGSGDNWRTLSKRFATEFEVHLIDLPNHGRSPHTDEMSYRSMAEDVVGYMDQKQLDAVHLVGHSMGGKVAMTCALMYPDTVKKLVVVDIAPRQYESGHEDIFKALEAFDLSSIKQRSDADKQLARHVSARRVRQFLTKNLQRSKSGGFHWKMNLPVIQDAYTDLISWPSFGQQTFPEPTMLIWGTKSDYVSDEDLDKFIERFPLSRFASIDAGHWLHAESPDEFYALVQGFLMEV